MNALRQGWVITQRDLLHWVRQPAAPVFNALFTVMIFAIFALLFGGALAVPGGGDYLDYLLPGMLALSMMFGLETTMTAMSADAKRGITDRFRSLPISSVAVVLGRAGADLATSVVQLVFLVVGGLVIGWRADGSPGAVPLAVVLLLWLRFSLLWLGIFLGLVFRSPGAASAIQIVVWPLGFLSNAFVASETMPTAVRLAADWNPISGTATAVRRLFGNPTGITATAGESLALPLAIGWPLVITAVFVPLSARAYRRLRR